MIHDAAFLSRDKNSTSSSLVSSITSICNIYYGSSYSNLNFQPFSLTNIYGRFTLLKLSKQRILF